MWEFDGYSDYLKIAPRRLADALELLEPPTRDTARSDAGVRHLQAAMYLAGYAVECALKAYVISRVSTRHTFRGAIQERRDGGEAHLNFDGARAHNLALLLSVTDLEARMGHDPTITREWGVCA